MKEFVEINGYGRLFVDRVFFESYFPIIFTCVNEKKDLFLCICCQNNEKGCKWLIGKTSNNSIVSMLKDELTTREVLLEHSIGRITVDYVRGEYKISFDNSDWEEESIFLPKKGAYLDAEEDEFEEDILYYSFFNRIQYNETFYKNISATVGIVAEKIEPISDIISDFATILEKITIPSEVMSTTLEVMGELCKAVSLGKETYTKQENFKPMYRSSYTASQENVEIKLETSNNTLADAA